jgi:hypothetical protein
MKHGSGDKSWGCRLALAMMLAMLAMAAGAGEGDKERAGALTVEAKSDVKSYAGPVTGLIDRIVIKKPVVHQNLTVFPIAWTGEADPTDYATLSSAQKDKKLTVTELESASVPQLKLVNASIRPVFIMTGEVLTGAKQDRILAHDLLILSDQKEVLIPVYCVELGRWNEKSKDFSSAENLAPPDVRGRAQTKSSQGGIWDEVGEVNKSLNFDGSGSMQQGFNDEKSKSDRAQYTKALADLTGDPSVAGAVVVINGKIADVDVFSSPRLFAALWPKLLDSYAMDAMRRKGEKKSADPGAKEIQSFLAGAFSARYRELNNPGQGKEFIVEAKNVQGSVLVSNDKIVHLALFPAEEKKPNDRPGSRNVADRVPNDVRNQVQSRDYANGPSKRDDSFKKDGVEFEIKNPSAAEIKAEK